VTTGQDVTCRNGPLPWRRRGRVRTGLLVRSAAHRRWRARDCVDVVGLYPAPRREGAEARTNTRDDKLDCRFWRTSFEQRQCLVPATSFCEPHDGRKPSTWHWLPCAATSPRRCSALMGVAALARPDQGRAGPRYRGLQLHDDGAHALTTSINHERSPARRSMACRIPCGSGRQCAFCSAHRLHRSAIEIRSSGVRWSSLQASANAIGSTTVSCPHAQRSQSRCPSAAMLAGETCFQASSFGIVCQPMWVAELIGRLTARGVIDRMRSSLPT
jgi:hypothetical protein